MAPLRGAIAEDKELCRLKSDKLKLNVTPSNRSSQTLNALLILSVICLLRRHEAEKKFIAVRAKAECREASFYWRK